MSKLVPQAVERAVAAGAVILGLVILASCTNDSNERPPAPERPHVVLITVDTLRADHLGCYGYERETSPNLDRLSRQALVFEQAVAAAPSTGPSVATIMTGRYPRFHSYGHDNGRGRLVEDEITLAEVLRDAGWATAAFVSNPVLSWRSGLNQGFEHYDEEMLQKERARGIVERTAGPSTDAVLDWFDARDEDDRPVFLWVHYQDPHGPYTPPQEFRDTFAPETEGRMMAPCRRGLGSTRNDCVPTYQRLEKPFSVAGYVGRYDGEIRYVDRELGRLLDGLRERGIGDDAWFLLTADHGESFGENGRYFQHGHDVTRELSNVPMILRLPRGAKRGRVEAPVSHVDIFRTLAALAGPGAPDAGSGSDLAVDLTSLAEGGATPDRAVFCTTAQQLAVLDAEHMLVGRPRILPAAAGGTRPAFEGQWLARYRDDPQRRIEDASRRAALIERANAYLALPEAQFTIYRPEGEHRKQLESLGYLQGN